ncbi:MAG: peroxiredoxin [Myxococcales bacterium]|nr:peroxiredoxin [Myxococcales bacterium]
MGKLRVGDAAPDFSATAGDGTPVRLADYRGRHLVLYFYPKAFTPGCTAQAKAFAAHDGEIGELGAAVVGVSTDPPPTVCDFGARFELPFPLIGDEDGSLARSYGVRRALLGMAKRVTFVVDPEGRIAGRFHHEVRTTRHVDDVLELLRERQA